MVRANADHAPMHLNHLSYPIMDLRFKWKIVLYGKFNYNKKAQHLQSTRARNQPTYKPDGSTWLAQTMASLALKLWARD